MLKTFGFKPRKEPNTKYLLPPTFEEWNRRITKTFEKNVSDAILKNTKLMAYLKTVVNLIRSNPSIINKELQKGKSVFAERVGLSTFVTPTALQLKSRPVADFSAFTMALPLSASIPNMSGAYGMPGMGMMPGMMGAPGMMVMPGGSMSGGACPNANNLRAAFDLLYNEMENNGKVLIDSDKNNIKVTIDELGNLEYQLIHLMDDVKLFTKLNGALGRNTSVEEVSIKDIVSQDKDNVTGNTLYALQQSLNENITNQNALISKIVRAYTPLTNTDLAVGNKTLRRVNNGF